MALIINAILEYLLLPVLPFSFNRLNENFINYNNYSIYNNTSVTYFFIEMYFRFSSYCHLIFGIGLSRMIVGIIMLALVVLIIFRKKFKRVFLYAVIFLFLGLIIKSNVIPLNFIESKLYWSSIKPEILCSLSKDESQCFNDVLFYRAIKYNNVAFCNYQTIKSYSYISYLFILNHDICVNQLALKKNNESICSYANKAEVCINQFYVEKEKKVEELIQKKQFDSVAEFYQYCKLKIFSEAEKQICYNLLIKFLEKPLYDFINNENLKEPKLNYIVVKNDVAVCSQINDVKVTNECYSLFSEIFRDQELCNNLQSDEINKKYCKCCVESNKICYERCKNDDYSDLICEANCQYCLNDYRGNSVESLCN